jgi:ribosomal protein S18 acetylase RimI-like enzyme
MATPDLRNDDAQGANAFMAYRESASNQSAAAELEAMFADENAAPAQPAPAQAPAAPGRSVVGDVARGVVELPRALFTGVRDAAQETLNLFGDIGDWVENQVQTGGFEISREGIKPISYEELRTLRAQGRDVSSQVTLKRITGGVEDPQSTTGKAVKGISQFVAGFVGASKAVKALKPATRAGRVAKAAGTGAVVDFTVFDPQEERLSNLLQEVPVLKNPVTDFLAADPKDSNAEGRFKNAIEGLGVGVAVDGLILGLKTLRQARIARLRQEEIAKAREAAGVEAQRPAVDETAFRNLGDDAPDAPLVGVAKRQEAPKAPETPAAAPGVPVAGGAQPAQLKAARAAAATEGVTPEQVVGEGRKEVEQSPAVQLTDGYQSVALGDSTVEVSVRDGHAEIIMVKTPENKRGQGAARKALTEVLRAADARGLVVTLTPDPMDLKTSKAKLEKFYRSLGFVPNKGRDKDYRYSGSMIRAPRDTPNLPVAEPVAEGVTPAQVVGEGGTGVPRGTEPGQVYINFARINAPEDVQTVIKDMADKFAPQVETAQRGVRSFAEIELDAQQVNAWDVLMARRKGDPLNAEQSVAARQLWAASGSKLSEVAKEAATNPSEANLFAFRKMLATHYAIQNEVIAARTETARALASWRIPAGGSAERFRDISQAIEANGGAAVTRDMADRVAKLANAGMYQELDTFVQRGVLARTGDAMQEAWIMGLLSGPKTHIVNVMSNAAVVFMQMYERKVASTVSNILGNSGGVQAGEAMTQWFGLTQSFKDGLRYAAKAAKTGETGFGMNKIELPQTAAITSDAFNLSSQTWAGRAVDGLGNIIRIPGRALAAQDEFFKTIGYRMELNAQALRQAAGEVHSGLIPADGLKARVAELLENPPENLRMSAVDQALYQTFTNSPGKLAQSLQSLKAQYPALTVILPFVRTPANILKFTFERTPLAPLMASVRADLSAGGARQELALARLSTGTALMMVAADMAMSGIVSGSGPKDTRERQALERTGWQRNSIKIGERWYAYNRLDPAGSLLGLAAEMVEILNNSEDEDTEESVGEAAVAAVASISATVMSKTYLSGLADLFEAISDPKRYTESFVQRLVGSTVPAIVGEAARAADPYGREVFNMLDAIKRRVPGLSDDLPLRRDLWGRPVSHQSGLGWAYDVFSPIYTKPARNEPIDEEMLRLGKAVSMPSKKATFQGVNIDLNAYPGAYSRYVELAGNELKHPNYDMGAKDLLNAMISGEHFLSEIYNQGTDGVDGTKAEIIDAIVGEYRKLAREQVLQEFPEIQGEIDYFMQAQQEMLSGAVR